MCLGWKSKENCQTVQVTPPACPAACPDITWFWVGVAAVAAAAMVKQK